MKRYIIFTILLLLAVAVSVGAVWGSGILYAAYSGAQLEAPQLAELDPAEKVITGSDVHLKFRIKLPADRSIVSAQLTAARDCAVIRELAWKREKWQWSSGIWDFSAVIRPLSAGEIGEGEIKVVLSPARGRRDTEAFTIAVPAFTSGIPDGEKPGAELALAGAMVEPSGVGTKLFSHLSRYKYMYTISAVVLAAVLFFVGRHFLKREVEVPRDSWDIALAALESLHLQIRHGDILPRAGYNELMDILRNYLELRFDLPASRRTTEEFLAELSRSDSPLPGYYQDKFGTFLNSVDLIRFANAPAGIEPLEAAVVQLIGFVRATVPVEVTQ